MFKKNKNVYVIAEAGINHNGSKKLALKLVDKAVEVGADAIKFQTFKTDLLVTEHAKTAKYQKVDSQKNQNQYEMLKKLELTYDDFFDIKEYCDYKKINFLSTAFDFESLCFLTEKLKLDILKIPSGDLTNAPLLLQHALRAEKLLVSTGMSNLEEIKVALGIIAFGLLKNNEKPSIRKFKDAFESNIGKKILQEKVVILKCTSSYPAPFKEINLNSMTTFKKLFNLNIGFSDHSLGITAPIIAASLGAKVIEKHFTLDKKMNGPDHKTSLEPKDFKNMVAQLRKVKKILGSKKIEVTKSAKENHIIATKSIVAKTSIKKGENFTALNITCKRPGNGISPLNYWKILEKKSTFDYKINELIKEKI